MRNMRAAKHPETSKLSRVLLLCVCALFAWSALRAQGTGFHKAPPGAAAAANPTAGKADAVKAGATLLPCCRQSRCRGSLLVTDDGSNSIWRVRCVKK